MRTTDTTKAQAYEKIRETGADCYIVVTVLHLNGFTTTYEAPRSRATKDAIEKAMLDGGLKTMRTGEIVPPTPPQPAKGGEEKA